MQFVEIHFNNKIHGCKISVISTSINNDEDEKHFKVAMKS